MANKMESAMEAVLMLGFIQTSPRFQDFRFRVQVLLQHSGEISAVYNFRNFSYTNSGHV